MREPQAVLKTVVLSGKVYGYYYLEYLEPKKKHKKGKTRPEWKKLATRRAIEKVFVRLGLIV